METLYIKLYEKYSKLKADKDADMDKINHDQEVKFVDFAAASESLIEHLASENKRLGQNVDKLRKEIRLLRAAKDQQFVDFQERLLEEKKKNQQLSLEIEQLRNLKQEGLNCSNRSDQQEDGQVVSTPCRPHVSGDQFEESPGRMTRKRARLSATADPAVNSMVRGHVEQSTGMRVSEDHIDRETSSVNASKPECCQSYSNSEGPSKCLFQDLVECLTAMKLSVVNQPEGRCIRAIHQSSGYSFSLTWVNKGGPEEDQLVYNVSSLGTFATVAPKWMREVIMFSTSMCPVFFERVSRIIKNR